MYYQPTDYIGVDAKEVSFSKFTPPGKGKRPDSPPRLYIAFKNGHSLELVDNDAIGIYQFLHDMGTRNLINNPPKTEN